jgi:aspartyl/asparaginyl beta-hydroxylase (cupin superfamily)
MAFNYLTYMVALGPIDRMFDLYTGGRRRPVVLDVGQTCPQLKALEENAPIIRDELQALLDEKAAIPRYHDLDPAQEYISAQVDPEKDWKVFYLDVIGEKPEVNRARCPRTSALLDQVPGRMQAFFSILEAGKSIPAHSGPYRGYLRYHLALIVPRNNPPSIRVKDQHYTWQEGRSVLFDDSWEHEVINHSDGDRVVLIVDIRRPMPPPFDALNRFVISVMRRLYGKSIMKKLA